ncbi:MAG: dephospho-CoA kinase [Gemmatimonadaceae bacterium]
MKSNGAPAKVIALTGNIASGKSVVAEILERKGATIIDADELSREAVVPGSPALDAIVARWGQGVLSSDGTLDRAALRKTVFHHQSDLDALNEIVHPEVQRLRESLIEAARMRGDRVVVSVIPLLFERHLADDFDYIVLVDAPRDIRLERIVRDRGLEEAEAMDMIASQMPAELKRARADWVIENAGSKKDLEREVDKLWDEIVRDDVPLSASNAP